MGLSFESERKEWFPLTLKSNFSNSSYHVGVSGWLGRLVVDVLNQNGRGQHLDLLTKLLPFAFAVQDFHVNQIGDQPGRYGRRIPRRIHRRVLAFGPEVPRNTWSDTGRLVGPKVATGFRRSNLVYRLHLEGVRTRPARSSAV